MGGGASLDTSGWHLNLLLMCSLPLRSKRILVLNPSVSASPHVPPESPSVP